jgi:Flp pilus assembly protein TadD
VSSRPLRIAAVVACLAASAWSLALLRDERRLDDAQQAVVEGRFGDAERLAASTSGPTIGARASRTAAEAAYHQGDLRGAERAMRTAVREAPSDWATHRDHAVVLGRLGNRSAAASEIAQAIALNPRMELPPGFARPHRRHPR